MFESVNEVAVITSTIVALAIGSIWYSPLLFGQQWMRAVGMTDEELDASKDQIPRMFFLAILANLVALFIVAQFIALSKQAGMSLQHIAVLLIFVIGAFISNAIIWEEKPLSYLFINVGYVAVVILEGIAIIGYWPW